MSEVIRPPAASETDTEPIDLCANALSTQRVKDLCLQISKESGWYLTKGIIPLDKDDGTLKGCRAIRFSDLQTSTNKDGIFSCNIVYLVSRPIAPNMLVVVSNSPPLAVNSDCEDWSDKVEELVINGMKNPATWSVWDTSTTDEDGGDVIIVHTNFAEFCMTKVDS